MDRKTPSILIIDDDSRNIFALGLVLKSKGFSCLPAADAETGLKMIMENPEIGIVLLDMMMPGLDGYDAIALIRANPRRGNIPIIAVTAQAMPGDREKCLAAGADGYIAKPVDIDLLLDVLKKYV
jgi:CheY-like chemotaxis protein